MQFNTPLIKGKLIKRYKRFLADVELETGELVTAHCPNTGAMTGCAEPGFEVWLSPSNNPKRKLAFTWELAIDHSGQWIGINTQNANKLVFEAIQNDKISELTGYDSCTSEVKYGEENSRIDFLLTGSERQNCFIEVKSVTLLDNAKLKSGIFPDAKTTRGAKHLRELAKIAKNGDRAIIFFCVQHSGIDTVSVAEKIDPVYAEEMQHAIAAGVEVMAYGCKISQEKLYINQRLKFIF